MTSSSSPSTLALEREVADAFDLGAPVTDVQPLGNGLINDTYLVTAAPAHPRVVLQRVNRRAFPRPELIIENMRVLIEHARAHRERAALHIPDIFRARNGADFVVDRDGGFWRAISYIENTKTFQTVANLSQAQAAGTGLGRFHALVADIEPQRMHATRPRFHNTPAYFSRFVEVAAHSRIDANNTDLKWCIDFAKAHSSIVPALEQAKEHGNLKPRIIHGDPKLDNFLFDAAGTHVVSLIDLDTVQPGLVHYDIGDCLRSCANPAGESPANLDGVHFDIDICRALLTNYLQETRSILTERDYHYLFDAIRLIPFELGLRFLTDHLENDTYFKTAWRGQNLHRAMAQFRLAADIEKKEREIRSLISRD